MKGLSPFRSNTLTGALAGAFMPRWGSTKQSSVAERQLKTANTVCRCHPFQPSLRDAAAGYRIATGRQNARLPSIVAPRRDARETVAYAKWLSRDVGDKEGLSGGRAGLIKSPAVRFLRDCCDVRKRRSHPQTTLDIGAMPRKSESPGSYLIEYAQAG